jgi:predicted nuclease of predicted toxin-antitoxin system
VRLALDHHYSPAIAGELRKRGHDAVAAIEREWHTLSDEELLAVCAAEQRALVSNNVADFMAIIRAWAVQGQPHAGVIFTSDRTMPRTRATIGRYVTALSDLHEEHSDGDFADRVHWI